MYGIFGLRVQDYIKRAMLIEKIKLRNAVDLSIDKVHGSVVISIKEIYKSYLVEHMKDLKITTGL